IKDSRGKMPRVSRLFRIIVSESAYLIWKVRKEQVVGGCKHTETGIHNRWVSFMNMQLKMDQLLTDRSRYGNRASDIRKVLHTSVCSLSFPQAACPVAYQLISHSGLLTAYGWQLGSCQPAYWSLPGV
ncbi:hypothetical protein B0H14DRAFT_2406669, partial [Mycena olivaceomarginata]